MSKIMTGQRKLTQKTSTPARATGEKDGESHRTQRTQGTAPNAPDLVLSSQFAGVFHTHRLILGILHGYILNADAKCKRMGRLVTFHLQSANGHLEFLTAGGKKTIRQLRGR